MMNTKQKPSEIRSEPRTILDQYQSVEFSISKTDPIFQFRVRDVSPSGMGILLSSGSKALEYLEVGKVCHMKYNSKNPDGSPQELKTEIRHITLIEEGRYKGQYLVGLLIIKG